MKRFVKQKGSALISALLMMSIVTVISVAMITRQDIEIRRTESVLEQERLVMQVAEVELWAIETLRAVAEQLTPDVDYITLEQNWTKPLPEFQQEGIWISGDIIDLQALFNLNDLLVDLTLEEEVLVEQNPENPQQNQQQPNNQQNPQTTQNTTSPEKKPEAKKDPLDEKTPYTTANMFSRLLMNVAKLKKPDAQTLTAAVLYWIMPDITETENIYLQAPLPYRPAHQPFYSVSELSLVSGVDGKIYNAIQPYLSAIPLSIEIIPNPSAAIAIPVNINTTVAPIIASIADIDLQQAQTLISARPYFDTETLQSQLNKLGVDEMDSATLMKMFSITSNYFLVRAYARDEKRSLVQYTLLHRGAEGKIQVLRRIQGEL